MSLVVGLFSRFVIFLSVTVYAMGWMINVGYIDLVKKYGIGLIIISAIGWFVLFVVSQRLNLSITSVQKYFILLILIIFCSVWVSWTLVQRWRAIDYVYGFTNISAFYAILQPSIAPGSDSTTYLACTLWDYKICLKIKQPNMLIYKPYQVCNIVGRLINKTLSKIKSYDLSKRTYLEIKNPKMICRDTWITNLFILRDRIVQRIERVIHKPQATLLSGIIFGIDGSYTQRFQRSIQAAGISHIVAASGYNVTILMTALDNILGWMPNRLLAWVKIIAMWIYALLTGFSSSMVRACVMASTVLITKLANINISAKNVLEIAYSLMFLLNPLIVFDLGFLLSVAATWGLMYLTDPIQSIIKSKWFPISTLACTISTLPITILHFNTISIYSQFSNMVILPMLEIVMILGVLGLFVKPILYVTYGNLKFVEFVTYSVEKLPLSIITLDPLPSIIIAAIVCLSVIYLIRKTK